VRTIAVANLKGGVGKTTTAVYPAHLLAAREPTVLVDTDIQGSACVEGGRTDVPVPGRRTARAVPYLRDLARRLPELAGGGAVVVIDTPRSPGQQQPAASAVAGRWPRVSVDLPPDVHDALTRFAFEHGQVKVMHLGQALFETLLADEALQQRVLSALPGLRRKNDGGADVRP
jgi:chromosome partitioning protein